MSDPYTESRIRAALDKVGGDSMKARELVIAMARKDQKLLLGIAEPYLQGLVAHTMEQLDSQSDFSEEAPGKIKKTRTGRGTDFGLGLLKAAVSSRAEIFGLETPQTSGKDREASQEHIDAILKIAKKGPSSSGRE